jgi:hypothetical protein
MVDYDDLLTRERQRRYQKLGALQDELYRLVEQGDREVIPVLIKLSVPEPEPIDKTKLAEGRELEVAAEMAAAGAVKLKGQSTQLLKTALEELDIKLPEQFSQSGPFVSARFSTDAIRRLSKSKRILFIGVDNESEIPDYPTIPESLPTTLADHLHTAGYKGDGVKIAILESGMPTHPISCFNIGAIQDTSLGANSHMTKSIGIVGNRYQSGSCSGNWEGYAPEATVLLANASNYKDRYDWAKANGVNVVTMSWHFFSEETDGSLHSRDVYFDYWVTRYPWPSVFTSAGNQAASDAYASGKGHNFFGVANVLNDGDGNRYNDSISSSSSWRDPTSPAGDREVPEIASPGSRHVLLGTSFGGTSCATPVTASIAALLMSKNPSLKIWPEAVRAILLATANYQNADGANWSRTSDGKDGTGMTNASYAGLTAGRRETTDSPQFRAHDYGLMAKSDFSTGFFNKEWKAYTSTTNARIRICLTWNSKVTSSTSPDVLDADLDLWVYDPDMLLVERSQTYDSSYEFAEFTPAKRGAYTIKIRRWGTLPDDFSSYYGVAWTTHHDAGP